MRSAVVLFIASTALTLAACIISTDGLSGGTSTPPNAPDSSSSAPGSEGGIVTPVNEAGTPVDAGVVTDAEAGADAQTAPPFFVSSGTAGWCAGLSPQPKTCFDFDEGSDLTGFVLSQNEGTLTIGSVATSPPHALLGQMTDSQTGNAFATISGSQNPTSVVVQSDVFLDPANGYVEFNSVYFSYSDTSSCALEPAENSGQIVLNEYCSGDVGNLSVNHLVTPIGATPGWYTILYTVDFTTRQFDAWAKAPDGTVAGFAQPLTLNQKIVTGLAREFLGIAYANAASPPTKLRVDNLVFDYQ